jgi:glyoxylase-like metal-dependent hydrolase (beta-lactamase superfamily II)
VRTLTICSIGAAVAACSFAAAPAIVLAQGRGAQPAAAAGARAAAGAEIRVTKVRPNVYMLTGAGGNITVMTFEEGALVVDTGAAAMADQVLEAIKQLSPKPIADIINTSASADHVGGNAKLAASGRRLPLEVVAGEGPMVLAHENVMTRMSAPTGKEAAAPERAWPNETYHLDAMKLSTHFHGGEAVELVHVPAAHSDGDSIVWLRHADVIATGDIFMTTTYPIIDVATGGTVDGVLDGLNRILDISFPDYRSEGGTMIVPGHGRLSDMADVGYYRDMVTIIRDRVRDMIKKGQTLDQVKAAKPTRDYDGRFGATTGPWTTDMFVEAVYKTLSAKK